MKREKELGEGESLKREIQSLKSERDIPFRGRKPCRETMERERKHGEGERFGGAPGLGDRECMERERDLGERLEWDVESACREGEICEST